MTTSTPARELPFESAPNPNRNEVITSLPYHHGTLFLSGSGRDLLGLQGPETTEAQVAWYQQHRLGAAAANKLQPIGHGNFGEVYDFAPGSNIVVKEIDQRSPDAVADPRYLLAHMENIRHQVEATGQNWIDVPRHYSLFVPDHNDPHQYLSMQGIDGVRLWDILNDAQEVPAVYGDNLGEILQAHQMAEGILRRAFQGSLEPFDVAMEDWGSQNVIVEHTAQKDSPFQFKFWVIDQVGPSI